MKVLELSFGTRRFWTPSSEWMNRWALKAIGRRPGLRELTQPLIACKVVSLAESRRLNREYRGFDKPTNVLSFGADDANPHLFLGDLAICPAVVVKEAQAQGKVLSAHWAHLVVHGTLHLLGFDHQNDEDAALMERREIRIMRELGFLNPYLEVGRAQQRRRR
jgi:probable rRNA maturation factor